MITGTSIYLVAPYTIEGVENATIFECASYLDSISIIGVDIETSRKFKLGTYKNENIYKPGLDPYLSKVVMLQIGDLNKVFVIDVRHYTKEELEPIFHNLHYREDKLIVGVNLRFEGKHMKHTWEVRFKKIWDAMIVDMVLWNGIPMRYTLAAMAERYLGVKQKKDNYLFESMYDEAKITLDDDLLKTNEEYITPFEIANNFELDKSTRLQFLTIGDKNFTYEQVMYGADDIIFPILIRERQMIGRKISEKDIYYPELCIRIENAFVNVLADIELNGMRFNKEKWIALAEKKEAEYQKRMKELNKYVTSLYPHWGYNDLFHPDEPECLIQWSSSKQTIKFFKELQLCPKGFSKQTGRMEDTVGAKEMTKQLKPKYKILYDKGVWEEFEKDENGKFIEDHQKLILAFLNIKKLEQCCTTFGKEWVKSYIHPITGRVHTSYRQILNTGRISSTNPNCVSLDTEILTPTGWKKYFEVTKGTEVYAFDKNEEMLKIEKVEEYYLGEGKDVVEFKENRNFNAITTMNHRHLFKDRKNGKYKVLTSKEFVKDAHILNASIYNKGRDLNKEFIVLLCATQADGSIVKGCKDSLKVDYSFTKDRKAERLLENLKKIGIEFSYKRGMNGRHRFVVNYPINYFTPYLSDKCFTYRLLELSLESREFLLKELMNWDGLFTRKSNYSSNKEIDIDVIHAVAAITNIRTRKREYTNSGKNKNISYQLDFVWKQNYTGTANTKIEYIGDRPVWCVKVPSSFIICRRGNGSPFITGNCQQIPGDKEYRQCFDVEDDECMINNDYSSQESRCVAVVSDDKSFINFFLEGDPVFGDDFHSFTATKIKAIMSGDPNAMVQPKELPDGSKNPNFTADDNERRGKSKIFNFGFVYGKSAAGFAEDFGCTVEEAQQMIDSYLEAFQGLNDYFEAGIKFVTTYGFIIIDPITGRRWFSNEFERYKSLYEEGMKVYKTNEDYLRCNTKEEKEEWKKQFKEENPWFRQIWKEWSTIKGSLERRSKNYRIQGLAGSQMKLAMNLLRDKIISNNLKMQMVNIIHDESLSVCKKIHGEEYGKIVQKCMEDGGNYFCKYKIMKASYQLENYWTH